MLTVIEQMHSIGWSELGCLLCYDILLKAIHNIHSSETDHENSLLIIKARFKNSEKIKRQNKCL